MMSTIMNTQTTNKDPSIPIPDQYFDEQTIYDYCGNKISFLDEYFFINKYTHWQRFPPPYQSKFDH